VSPCVAWAVQGEFRWVKQFGSEIQESHVAGSAIAVDALGEVCTVGRFWGQVNFDVGASNFSLVASGSPDIFICKHDNTGRFLWAKQFRCDYRMWGSALKVDQYANIYLTGYFDGTADFDPGPSVTNLTSKSGPGFPNIYVCKLSYNGQLLWAKAMGGITTSLGKSIAVDSIGNVYVTGYFFATVDFDPGPGVANRTSAGNADFFITKFDSSGSFVWARRIGSTAIDIASSIAIDPYSNVYVSGSFQGTVDFDPGAGTQNLTAMSNCDTFTAKFDSSGDIVWAKQFGSNTGDHEPAIKLDSDGNVLTLTRFAGTADFDPGVGTATFTSLGTHDAAVSKLDSAGNFVWAKHFASNNYFLAQSITTDKHDEIYIAGSLSGPAVFDPDGNAVNLENSGGIDSLIVKLDSTGNLLFVKQLPGSVSWLTDLTLNQVGEIYGIGGFRYFIDCDPGPGTADLYPLNSNGNENTFVLKLSGEYPQVLSVRASGSNPTVSTTVDFTVTFDQPVTGVDLSDFELKTSGLSGTSLIAVSEDTGTTRTVTVNTGVGNGTIRLEVLDDDSIVSASALPLGGTGIGNGYFNRGETYTIDNVLPNVTISSPSPAITNQLPIVVTFSEPVTGFSGSDITAPNCTVSGFSGSGAIYSFTLIPSIQGLITVDIAASVCTDLFGNPNTTATQLQRTFDGIFPKYVFTKSTAFYVNAPTPASVEFDEPVVGFDSQDIVAINATITDFQVSGLTYTFNIAPIADGLFTFYIPSSACHDLAGNPSASSSIMTLQYDTVPPVIALKGSTYMEVMQNAVFVDPGATATDFIDRNVSVVKSGSVNTSVPGTYALTYDATDDAGNLAQVTRTVRVVSLTSIPMISSPAPDPTNDDAIVVYIDFDRDIVGLEANDIRASNGSVTSFSGAESSYWFVLTAMGQGLVAVDIDAGVCADLLGNPNAKAVQFTRMRDTIEPEVSVTSVAPNPTNASPIAVSVTFTEPVTGFVAADIVCSNGTTSNFAGSGENYAFQLLPSGGGLVSAYVPARACIDSAGNANVASNLIVREVDNEPPLITLTGENLLIIEQFTQYTEHGATAFDNNDGDITSSILLSGAPNTDVVGYYILTYSVADAAGNSAIPRTRGILVTEAGVSLPINKWFAALAMAVVVGFAAILWSRERKKRTV
ncbi:MAG TPA: Ig-like domain-containing protein, partial [Candidatus Hydrogenedentes bacterium]|nr:Ig-like domain-containing protein [Candidatus Hydrogenedentota bacterium]